MRECISYHLLLSDPMRSSLSLEIALRIPVSVKMDDGVGRLQVDAESARSVGDQVDKEGTVGVVIVPHDVDLAPDPRRGPVEPQEAVSSVLAVHLEEVQNHRKARKQQNAVILRLEPSQQLVEDLEL